MPSGHESPFIHNSRIERTSPVAQQPKTKRLKLRVTPVEHRACNHSDSKNETDLTLDNISLNIFLCLVSTGRKEDALHPVPASLVPLWSFPCLAFPCLFPRGSLMTHPRHAHFEFYPLSGHRDLQKWLGRRDQSQKLMAVHPSAHARILSGSKGQMCRG
jgi:hypothetical protein